MCGLQRVFILVACINFSTVAEYIDDSDYDDYEMYEDLLPQTVHGQQSIKQIKPAHDDFYIINDQEQEISQSSVYFVNDNVDLMLGNDDGSVEMINPLYQQLKWFKGPEKVYQYTKHRIPGYDYEELDFGGGRRYNKCDIRSIWSHCVCQFTCSNPNEVDCYMPCMSGCECKESFVFDENAQRCIPPEMCPMQHNFNILNE